MRITPTQALAHLQPQGKKKAKRAKAIEMIDTIGVAEVPMVASSRLVNPHPT